MDWKLAQITASCLLKDRKMLRLLPGLLLICLNSRMKMEQISHKDRWTGNLTGILSLPG